MYNSILECLQTEKWLNDYSITYQLSYSKSRDAIASKNSHRITITLLKIMSIKSHVGATELQLPY